MIDKNTLAMEIGNFFGTYFEENDQFYIDNDDEIRCYNSLDDLLRDWVYTLIEQQHDSQPGFWENEIIWIFQNVIGKYPAGVRPIGGKRKTTWQASADVTVPGETDPKGKNLFLGTYASIVDAVYARNTFWKIYKELQHPSLVKLEEKAKAMRLSAKEKWAGMYAGKVVCPNCGATWMADRASEQ